MEGCQATPFNIYLASAVKSSTESIISGALFQSYTLDGTHFSTSENLFLSCWNAGIIPGKERLYAFHAANAYSGLATSSDGKKWQLQGDLKLNVTNFLARYGSYQVNAHGT